MAGRKRQVGQLLCGFGLLTSAVPLISLMVSGELPVEATVTFGGVLLAGAGFALLLQRASPASGDASDPQAAIEAARTELKAERESLEQFRNDLEGQLEQRAHAVDKRESELANRLIAFQEWLEYPQPDGSDDGSTAARQFAGPELEIKDRRVIELLEAEAKLVYERIRDGRYREDGQLRIDAIRDDTLDLIQRVAQVYQPDCDNPLLETSVDKLLRAGSRVCLHLLVVLERLPLDLHEENFSTLHEYMRKAVKAYDVYSAAEPYLGYASKALYAGRLAMGANPLTLGITWALGELGRRGVKAVGKKFVDQQAVALLGDLVRVIGFEVAGIYGGDFRHRDPNWVYGSELTELMSRFPVSRQNLAHALREVGALTFRNEYDRVFLYRCLSTHRSAGPPSTSQELLPPEVRQEIARKLESFFRNFVHGKTARVVADWQRGAETRLGLRLKIEADSDVSRSSQDSGNHDAAAAIESLIAFATAVKCQEIEQLSPETLAPELAAVCGSSIVSTGIQNAAASPPQFFDGVDIDPDSKLADAYLADLVRLTVRSEPVDIQPDDLVLETAVWLNRDAATIRRQLDAEYSKLARELLPEDAPTRKVSAATTRTLLVELQTDEELRFVYPDTHVRDALPATSGSGRPADELMGYRDQKLWLTGTNQRLLLIAESSAQVVATSTLSNLSAAKGDGVVVSECNLNGGQWSFPGQEESFSLALTIAGGMMSRFDSWFRPLLEVVRSSD
ncbi:MAG: hypothetical protein ACYTGL_27635 [Planctomycetota bacterium]